MKIKRLNAISDIVMEYLPPCDYTYDDQAEDPDAILVRSAAMHDKPLPPSLLAIGRAGAGVNNIPVDQCSQAGIAVFNTPGANANAVKELVICGLLLSGRGILEATRWAQGLKGKGDAVEGLVEKGKNQFVGPELRGKTLGVIGLGAIGAMVANAARGLDMDVIGYDPSISIESAWGLSRSIGRATTLSNLLACSDYISIHVPLMEQTRCMVCEQTLSQMKNGVVILNFSRAQLVEEAAMLNALACGKVRKYVTDFPTDAMLCQPDIIAIPHLGASTPESEENCAAMAARQIRDYLADGTIHNAVNLPSCEMPRSGLGRIAVIHRNAPNMVGQITAILALDNHNIANMVNRSMKDMAYTLMDLDSPVNGREDDLIASLKAIQGVYRVRVL